MASSAVMTAFETRLAANWSHTPIVTPNTKGAVPADGSEFLLIEYPVATEEMKSVGAPGSNIYREEGGAYIVLCVPTGIGLNPAATPWASRIDTLRAAFRGKNFDGVVTFEVSPPYNDDQSDRGAYTELSFSVAYWFDITG